MIQTRAGFLAAARAFKASAPSLVLQGRARRPDEAEKSRLIGADTTRIGFTCSKKVGNAVARNRAKRRLRAAAQEVLHASARPGWDYVLIGLRSHTAARPFAALCADLSDALARIHAKAPS